MYISFSESFALPFISIGAVHYASALNAASRIFFDDVPTRLNFPDPTEILIWMRYRE